MGDFNSSLLRQLYMPSPDSHKGQNGKLLIIGGSHLFHAASLWSLKVASRIVDMVFYSSVPENNEIVQKAKEEFHDGIIVKREELDNYIKEADCVLVGPGMNRAERIQNSESRIQNLKELEKIKDEGEQTYFLTKYLLEKYPEKRFVLDAGALQMMEAEWLSGLKETPILTPHQKEFERLFAKEIKYQNPHPNPLPRWERGKAPSPLRGEGGDEGEKFVKEMARKYNCVILLKGAEDIACTPDQCLKVAGGNAGMTKGGMGDVLAGLVASLYCKNEAFLSAACASYINKKAGEVLFEKVGYYFNSSDLADEIPKVMKELILQ